MTIVHGPRQQATLGLEQLATLVRAQSWQTAGSPSLPPTQAAVIRMLFGAPDGLKARRMAERLGISPSSLSDSLKALDAKAWIVREADPVDRRASSVRLSKTGRTLARRLCDPSQGMGRLLQDLEDEDIGALLRVTQLLVMQAQRQGLATGLRTCLGCQFFRPFGGSSRHPHFCELIGKPFGDAELRSDCAEQSPADGDQLAANLARFRLPVPP
jgi:DNA-binding MarR family transcriptional regulator